MRIACIYQAFGWSVTIHPISTQGLRASKPPGKISVCIISGAFAKVQSTIYNTMHYNEHLRKAPFWIGTIDLNYGLWKKHSFS